MPKPDVRFSSEAGGWRVARNFVKLKGQRHSGLGAHASYREARTMEDTLVKRSGRRPAVTYGVAVVVPLLALLVRIPFSAVLTDKVPYITFFLATAISASFGGVGPGLVTTAIGGVLGTYFIVPSRGEDAGDLLGLVLFLSFSSFISYMAGRLLDSRKHQNALRVLFQQTLLSMGDALISVDAEQRVRLLNPIAEKLTGWTQSEARGKPASEVFRIVREGTDEPSEIPFERILKTGMVLGLANHTEIITKTGERIPIDDSGAPIRDEAGEVAGAVLVFRDVTERRDNEAALLRLNEDLKQFTFAATHDIREPLRMITVYTQMLARKLEGTLDDDARALMTNVENGALRIAHLVDSLLDFTRLRVEQIQAVRVETGAALKEALENLAVQVRESNAEITVGNMPTVLAEFTHVCQVFQNLVGNAIKYRTPGVPLKVDISSRRDGERWILAVRDNGIGIASEHQQQVFVPFKRLHGPEIAGAGIGLATCKRIVERYSGQIWVESKPGEGSTFYFSLPSAEAAAQYAG
jgi:PAS domain S-box-containing protein